MIRMNSVSQIQYTLITPETSFSESNFHNKVLRLLREFPKDLLQLENTVDYFDFSFRFCLRKGIELFSISDSLLNIETEEAAAFFKEYSSLFNNALVKVFIIDSKIKSHVNIAKFIEKINHSYFTVINDTDNSISKYNSNNYFIDGTSLIALINRDKEIITKEINKQYPEIEIKQWDINPKRSFFQDNKLVYSNLAESNYFILNQIIGNFWIEDSEKYNDDDLMKLRLPSNKRIKHILSQAQKNDDLTDLMYGKKVAKRVSSSNPLYNTLILISPFHFPRLNRLFQRNRMSKKEKAILKLYKSEQRLDYCFEVDDNIEEFLTKKEIAQILGIMNFRLLFLDDVGYLHGLLSYSPVIRLPLVGKSINMDLSHLEDFKSTRKKAVSKISTFGYNLSMRILSDEIKDYLLDRNGQIAVISDLPIEWLYLNGFPLCYTHDVCRIPEFNQNGIVNNYIQNQRLNFLVKSNLIENTLIIHSASKSDIYMQSMFDLIDSFKDRYSFNSVQCSTVKEIKDAIELFKPEFLIFDCHGGFDKSTLSSYLVLDSENNIHLTGNDIVENNLSAPLVFLSACSTMPNYGYVKFLSDAFMQAGAFTVTATFMPISMIGASQLIIRLLGKLSQLRTSIIHTNWLEFISHVLRTTLIHEAIRKEQVKVGIDDSEIDHESIARILTETMSFYNRKEAINKLNTLLQKINPKFKFDFENLDNEWISYTTIGRADLIYFENWINKFRETNINYKQ